MFQNPRLRYRFSATFLDGDKVLLTSEKSNTILNGKIYSLVLAEILQNNLSLEELVHALEKQVSTFEIFAALQYLELQGFLTEAAPFFPPEVRAYWDAQGIEPHTLLAVLQKKSVFLQAIDPMSVKPLQQVLTGIGIQTSATPSTAQLRVVLTDNYGRQELRQINQQAMTSRQPWMLVKPVGVELWLGPLFLPGETGCWECLKQRLTMNRPMDTFYQAQQHTTQSLPVPVASTPLSTQIALHLTALEITRWLYFQKSDNLAGKIITLDTQNFTTASHSLVQRPPCPACGEPGYKRQPQPVVFKKNAGYNETSLGGYREMSAEDTIQKYQHHVSPITGVVQCLRPYFSLQDTPIYNYSSGHNMALQSKTMFWLNQHIRSASGGKGKTWSQAKTGALCEAIERYSLMYHGDEPFITSSLTQLGPDGIHPNDCMNFSQNQYQHREESNRASATFYAIVPIPFEPSLSMAWTPVYSLSAQKFKYLPACFCYAQYPAQDELKLFSYPDSNGCAAGNSIEEATLQGFLELVERDAVAIWWYNRLNKPVIDLTSFGDPYFLRLSDYYQSLNRSVYVLDITTDLGIPSFAAISHRIDAPKPENIVFGFGSHVDAKLGIERALVELNQILPIAQVPETDRVNGKYRTPDPAFVHWLNTATLENQPYLAPHPHIPRKTAADYPSLCPHTIFDALIYCVARAQELGLETLVLDLTRPDIGLNVTRVLVPGLRHFWKRLAPGRLYDVPVKMGWRATPLQEEELNPIALFI